MTNTGIDTNIIELMSDSSFGRAIVSGTIGDRFKPYSDNGRGGSQQSHQIVNLEIVGSAPIMTVLFYKELL